MTPTRTYRRNETAIFFRRLCNLMYLCSGSNFWFEDLKLPATVMKIYEKTRSVIEVAMIFFLISGWAASYTQPQLSQQQRTSVLTFGVPHVLGYAVHVSVRRRRGALRGLVRALAARLPALARHAPTEREMRASERRYLSAALASCVFTMLASGVYGGVQALTSNASFTTVVPAWPRVDDNRARAGAARVLYYVFWWIFSLRVLTSHLIILSLTICLSHQFRILRKYFESLDKIFEGDGSQAEKEKRYEDAFKFGIKMHSITLWSTGQLQQVGGVAFCAQVLINAMVLMLAMLQVMYTERSLLAMLPALLLATTALLLTGLFMWSAGDITVEASELPTAMFLSGWHHCQRGSSVRVRKLVTIAMTQAQKPVLINCFGVITLSYEAYVSIVKSSYTLFSVIY